MRPQITTFRSTEEDYTIQLVKEKETKTIHINQVKVKKKAQMF